DDDGVRLCRLPATFENDRVRRFHAERRNLNGVIGIIFEARPEAAVQIASLCMKSSNAVILKGGREAAQSNAVIVDAFREALAEIESFPVDAVQLLATREEVRDLLDQDEWVDLIIPRGSNELVRSIQENTRIPVLGHADGICAVYVDAAADVEKAVTVVVDSKAQYPSVCNATETLLVHADAVESVFPAVVRGLKEAGVELRCDERSSAVANAEGANWKAAIDEDYSTEFLELILAVKVVDSLDEAIEHINAHSSHHTEAIVTEDVSAAEEFMSRIDSAGVYHNASTRFADGFRYGFGAEVGVSTNKTHARGPVGLDGLVIYKYRMYGRGQGVSGYGAGKKPFLHDDLPKQLPS
ncbi:MAG: glutamate-5-semialdehyde dehydrogenase, partial [Planctomycetota bacterium]